MNEIKEALTLMAKALELLDRAGASLGGASLQHSIAHVEAEKLARQLGISATA